MLTIKILTVGKIKERYLRDGLAEYQKRLSAYCRFTNIEVADEKVPEKMSTAEREQAKQEEGKRLLSKIKENEYVIALTLDGQQLTSEQLADKIDQLALQGKSQVVFVIGGSLGLSSEVIKRSNQELSFGKFTFPHQLMRLILLEQVYRAFKINAGEPYHK